MRYLVGLVFIVFCLQVLGRSTVLIKLRLLLEGEIGFLIACSV